MARRGEVTTETIEELETLNRSIRRLEWRLARAGEESTALPRAMDGMPRAKGGHGDPVGNAAIAVTMLESELANERERREELLCDVRERIRRMPDPIRRTAMEAHFLRGVSADELARTLCFNRSYMYRFMARAKRELMDA